MKTVSRLGLTTLLVPLFVLAAVDACSSSTDGAPDAADAGSGQDGSAGPDASSASDAANDTSTNPPSDASAESASDAPSDAPSEDAGSDAAPEQPDANPCNVAPTTDFYVDTANGSDSNNGAPGCPLKTISAALVASAGPEHDNATIHLAAGTYGSGETFPLLLNHGRSLVGAGAGSTKIQGSSTSYNTSGTGSLLDTGTHYVTLVAGDAIGGATDYGRTTLSGFSLVPDASVTVPTAGYLGLACIVGNAPNTGTTLPLPSPNLLVQHVTVGPNFDVGMAIGSSPSQSTACNATITGSTFTGMNTGLLTGACGTANPVLSWPSAQIGDGVPSDANTFTSSTIDLFGGGCGSAQSINGNDFKSGYRGIVIVSQAAQYFEILNNSFDGAAGPLQMGIGLQTSATVTLNKLNANTFTNISQSAAADTAAGQATGFAMIVASVLQAHQNVVHDNDNGVEVGVKPAVSFDFSSDGVPANANQIYCNSKPGGGGTNGYDLLLNYTAGNSANFAGNMWDNATPSTSVSLTTSANGTDVVTGTSAGATTTGGAPVGVACSGNRAH